MTLHFVLAAKSLTLVVVLMCIRENELLRIWLKFESKLKFYIRWLSKGPLNFEYIFDILTSWLWNRAWIRGTAHTTYICSYSLNNGWLYGTGVC